MKAKTLMIQGTASHVGKSVITAAFCRIFKQMGYRVAPFKAQNMSNNSFVTLEGGEMGRAQAVQAEACGIPPSVLMNPVLLKPGTDKKAQVIVMGKPVSKISFIGEFQYQKRVRPVVADALETLRSQNDIVVIEGAGSPAEVNLKNRDIVNMHIAKLAKSPVLLVGDIDWGGIFAQLVGTYNLFSASERKLVCGFLINKFRGEKRLLDPGLKWIERKTKKKVWGVIPFLSDIDLAEEDSLGNNDSSSLSGLRANVCLDTISGKQRDRRSVQAGQNKLLIDIMWLPRMSNFTDFDTLKKEKDVVLRFLHEPDRHTLPDLVIIPGTKSTIDDLGFLRKSGLASYVLRCARAGVPILGICGGYQMLGKKILDPRQIESNQKSCEGLGLLPVVTTYEKKKTTVQVTARHKESGLRIQAYEIHMGKTTVPSKAKRMFEIEEPADLPAGKEGKSGKFQEDGICLELPKAQGGSKIYGTYLHGLFDRPEFLTYFLNKIRKQAGLRLFNGSNEDRSDEQVDLYDRLAHRIKQNLEPSFFKTVMQVPLPKVQGSLE